MAAGLQLGCKCWGKKQPNPKRNSVAKNVSYFSISQNLTVTLPIIVKPAIGMKPIW